MLAERGRMQDSVRDKARQGAGLDTLDESRYILVVDDDASICDLIEEVLREEGYEVSATRDAARALQLIKQRPPALILLDLSIADQSAESIVSAVRKLPGQSTSVIVVSGHTNVGQRAEQVGADGYLPKPFDIPILVDTVQAVLSVRRGGA